jgi:hypothetical protein
MSISEGHYRERPQPTTLSVVIPVFNRPKQFLLALGSVFRQRGLEDENIEVIVVDDNSKPPLNLEGWPARVVSLSRNSGPAAARNAGVRAASGELIAFLDSDDVWLPDKLQAQIALLRQVRAANPQGLHAVTCGFYYPTRFGRTLEARIPRDASNLSEFAGGCWCSPGSTLLVPKLNFWQVGAFDEDLRALEDFEWFLRFGWRGGHLHVAPQPQVVVFRQKHIQRDASNVANAADRIATKLSATASQSLEKNQQQAVKAYLHLERARAFFYGGTPLKALLSLTTSLGAKIQRRLSIHHHWQRIGSVPGEVRQVHNVMARLARVQASPPQPGGHATKLLFCIKGLTNPGGGAERVLAEITSGLAERGYRVSILTFGRPDGESYYPLHPNIQLIRLGLGPTDEPATFSVTLRRIFAMRSTLKRISPDVAIGFMHSMFVPLSVAAIGSRVPIIASEHTTYEHYRRRRMESVLLYLVSTLSDMTVCVSEHVRRSYPSVLARNMIIIPNPVGLPTTGRADVTAHCRKRKTLLAVGRLDAGKDHATLIDAFAKIAERTPDWDLRIAGEGVLRPELEEQIARLGLKDRISLPGAIKEISAEYRSAQLFVIPSRYESFSLTTA